MAGAGSGLFVAYSVNSNLTHVNNYITVWHMIQSFIHKGLKELLETGRSAKVRSDLCARVLRRLDAIAAAKTPEALNIPGFDFHALRGKPKRYSVHVNGPYCITFEWEGEDAARVNLENYHQEIL